VRARNRDGCISSIYIYSFNTPICTLEQKKIIVRNFLLFLETEGIGKENNEMSKKIRGILLFKKIIEMNSRGLTIHSFYFYKRKTKIK